MRDVVTLFIEFGGHVLMGGVILVIGVWLAGLARRVIEQADREHSVLFARIAQFAILGLVFAMGLRAMGIANEIVQLAFGLVLGAIAVAVALSFGLGGREAAGKLLDRWFNQRGGASNATVAPPSGRAAWPDGVAAAYVSGRAGTSRDSVRSGGAASARLSAFGEGCRCAACGVSASSAVPGLHFRKRNVSRDLCRISITRRLMTL